MRRSSRKSAVSGKKPKGPCAWSSTGVRSAHVQQTPWSSSSFTKRGWCQSAWRNSMANFQPCGRPATNSRSTVALRSGRERGRHLEDDRPHLRPERRHSLQEILQQPGAILKPLLVGDRLGRLAGEAEIARRRLQPMSDRVRRGHGVEGGIDLDGVEGLRVGVQPAALWGDRRGKTSRASRYRSRRNCRYGWGCSKAVRCP